MKEELPVSSDLNRRDFLRGGSMAAMMAMLGGVELLAPSAAQAADAVADGSKVRVGIIGLGNWGREITKTLGANPKAEIVALCDTYAASLRKVAKDAPAAKSYADYKELLADTNVQAVFIATPTHQHLQVTLEALKAGKHVYCEAPLANSVEEARQIAKAANALPKLIFQAGLQMRSDPQRIWLLPFIRSGSLGTFIMARAQSHKKQSWRSASPNPDREKELNWRLSRATSTGLMGEIGIHTVDQAGWFMNRRPVAVSGFNSLIQWKDGRDVPDTIHATIEYPGGVRLAYDATLANSFDADYEMLYGAYATVLMRESKAWMFKEVDSPLFGWEVYAKKEQFQNQTGIDLVAGASKQENLTAKPDAATLLRNSPLYNSLGNFLENVYEQDGAINRFIESYGTDDQQALLDTLKAETEPRRKPAASALEGFQATVVALKANEAILSGQRIELKDEWFQL
jgi:predicted dehydrogenase